MNTSLFEQEALFIKNLKNATGRSLEEWFGLIAQSSHTRFLDIRAWLVATQQVNTPTATTITQLYLEDVEKNAPELSFHQEGRSGDYRYKSREGSFTSWWEFGGGDVLAYLNVPSVEQWEAKTGIPLAKRAEVLDFIGQETVRRQTTSGRGRYEVVGDFINIYA